MEIKASTQEHLDIEDISDDYVILKNGGAAMVLQTTSVNFDLLSETEQDAMIGAFGNLLNSLSFPAQIIIRSKKTDISDYLKKLVDLEQKETDPRIKNRVALYHDFIQELVTKNVVLSKNFYFVISYRGEGIIQKNGPLEPFKRLFGMETKRKPVDVSEVLKRAKTDLEPKRDFILSELGRIGIKGRVLRTKELVELFFDIYNPNVAKEQKPKVPKEDFSVPLVEPAIEE